MGGAAEGGAVATRTAQSLVVLLVLGSAIALALLGPPGLGRAGSAYAGETAIAAPVVRFALEPVEDAPLLTIEVPRGGGFSADGAAMPYADLAGRIRARLDDDAFANAGVVLVAADGYGLWDDVAHVLGACSYADAPRVRLVLRWIGGRTGWIEPFPEIVSDPFLANAWACRDPGGEGPRYGLGSDECGAGDGGLSALTEFARKLRDGSISGTGATEDSPIKLVPLLCALDSGAYVTGDMSANPNNGDPAPSDMGSIKGTSIIADFRVWVAIKSGGRRIHPDSPVHDWNNEQYWAFTRAYWRMRVDGENADTGWPFGFRNPTSSHGNFCSWSDTNPPASALCVWTQCTTLTAPTQRRAATNFNDGYRDDFADDDWAEKP